VVSRCQYIAMEATTVVQRGRTDVSRQIASYGSLVTFSGICGLSGGIAARV